MGIGEEPFVEAFFATPSVAFDREKEDSLQTKQRGKWNEECLRSAYRFLNTNIHAPSRLELRVIYLFIILGDGVGLSL